MLTDVEGDSGMAALLNDADHLLLGHVVQHCAVDLRLVSTALQTSSVQSELGSITRIFIIQAHLHDNITTLKPDSCAWTLCSNDDMATHAFDLHWSETCSILSIKEEKPQF